MDVIRSSETSVRIRTRRRYVPEDGNIRNFRFENVILYLVKIILFRMKSRNNTKILEYNWEEIENGGSCYILN
jgi:hypothetical protein